MNVIFCCVASYLLKIEYTPSVQNGPPCAPESSASAWRPPRSPSAAATSSPLCARFYLIFHVFNGFPRSIQRVSEGLFCGRQANRLLIGPSLNMNMIRSQSPLGLLCGLSTGLITTGASTFYNRALVSGDRVELSILSPTACQ